MNKATFSMLYCFFYKIENLICDFVIWIKQFLLVAIQPVKCQILNSYWLPMIRDLSASTIDNMCNFIACDKFKVLRSQFIADEESIFDFNSTYHFRIHDLLLIPDLRLILILRRLWILNQWISRCVMHNVEKTVLLCFYRVHYLNNIS